MLPLYLIIALACAIGGFMFWRKAQRRRALEKLRNTPLPTEWVHILQAHMPVYRSLPFELRTKLHGYIQVFVATKSTPFSPPSGLAQRLFQASRQKQIPSSQSYMLINLIKSSCTLPAITLSWVVLSVIPEACAEIAPDGFSLIPGGEFEMGDKSEPKAGGSRELPVHSVNVSAFYMGKYEVSKELWDEVRAWGASNGYTDLPAGGGKAANHPVHSIDRYAMMKWCNARSQKEELTPCYTVSGATYKTSSSAPNCNWSANGYRLPSEAEWEKAARGGVSGKNFPWGDTINHSNANYRANSNHLSYDTSDCTTDTFHPTYNDEVKPYSSPVGSFAPNGYGLYNMAGNMYEHCWDRYGNYAPDSQTDPRGADSGNYLVIRGGSWLGGADACRGSYRTYSKLSKSRTNFGFRTARSISP